MSPRETGKDIVAVFGYDVVPDIYTSILGFVQMTRRELNTAILDKDERKNKMLDTIYQSVIEEDAPEVTEGVQRTLEVGHNPDEILNQAMMKIARRFEAWVAPR